MKKMSVLLLLVLPLVGFAEVVVPVDKVANSVNIRLEPDAGSDVVGKLRKGESLPLVSSESGWHEVQLEGDATGYISADWAVVRAEDAVAEDEPPVAEEAVEVTAEAVAETVEETVAETVEDAVEESVEQAVEETVEEAVEDTVAEAVADTVEDVVDAAADEAAADAEDMATVEATAEDEVELVPDPAPVAEPLVVTGPVGPPGPPGPPGAATIKGGKNFLVKFRAESEGGNSQIYDNGNQVGIGTTEPKQRLEVNGSIQIHEQNSSVAGLMITQSAGDTGYIMHNRAGTLTIGAGSQDRITIDRDGNVGIAASKPTHPLEMASGAHVTAGGVWTSRSSREDKQNIAKLPPEVAMAALLELEPVLFNYRNEQEEQYAGFIAEDVPEVVASRDRKSLSTMDVVAVLTKVVQEQQRKIEELEARLDAR